MKSLLFIPIVALILAACSSSPSKTNDSDSTAVADKSAIVPDTLSPAGPLKFIYTEGKDHHDTTAVELTLNGSKATGTMNWMPYQKDARRGKLEGTINGDTLHATWTFMQEGMTDTLALNFLLKTKQLSQKPLKLNTKTGRQQTDESAGYTLKYQAMGAERK